MEDGFRGVLAHADERPVGRCKVEIRIALPDLEGVVPVAKAPLDQIGCIRCFVVSPDHRHQGNWTVLVEYWQTEGPPS